MALPLAMSVSSLLILAPLAYRDWRTGHVPNAWIVVALFASLLSIFVQDVIVQDILTPSRVVAAMGTLALGYIIWQIGGIGAADIKVMAMIALLQGWPVFFVSLFIALWAPVIEHLVMRRISVRMVPYLALGATVGPMAMWAIGGAA